MRLNRGTLVLLLASIVIIVVVVLVNNQPANAPDLTPSPEATSEAAPGPIFPDIADDANQGDINRFEVVNNTDSTRIVMTRDEAGVWSIVESASPQDMPVDQVTAVGTMSVLASLVATDRFTAENLADFGLDQPQYTLMLTETDGTTYTLKIGSESPTNPRYYGLVNDDTATVYLLPKDLIDNLVRQITQPPYQPTPTPLPTATRTPNPLSEVEMTATADAQLTATAQATPEATAEATAAP